MKKRTVICIAIGMILIILVAFFLSAPKHYSKANTHIEVVNSCDLTIEELQSRNGKLIVEVVVGQVDDCMTGAGHVLDNPNFYISYASVENISNGNIIYTYFVYNPDSNYEDDIIYRYDVIAEK